MRANSPERTPGGVGGVDLYIRRPRYVYGNPSLYVAPAPPTEPGDPTPTFWTTAPHEIEQRDFKWTFSESVEYGQFANGDYFVVGPVTITAMSPEYAVLSEPQNNSSRSVNGCSLNPRYGTSHGYDSYVTGYSVNENIAADLPKVVSSGSLVSAASWIDWDHSSSSENSFINDATVLTVVPTVPPANSFRPPYSLVTKPEYWTTDDVMWDLLPRLEGPANRPAVSTVIGRINKCILGHQFGGGSPDAVRRAIPRFSGPWYNAQRVRLQSEIALGLLTDYEEDELRELAVHYIQFGLDLYGITRQTEVDGLGPLNTYAGSNVWGGYNHHLWQMDGGHGIGRKWPMLFAGMMLNDSELKRFCDAGGYRSIWGSPHQNGYPIFEEESQHFLVAQEDVDLERHSGWTLYPYPVEMIGVPEWGQIQGRAPNRSGSNWNASYRDICSNYNCGNILAARIMGAESLWNWDAVFDYMDRWIDMGWKDGDTPSPWSPTNDGQGYEWDDVHNGLTSHNPLFPFIRDMWLTYRDGAPYVEL